MWVYTKTIIRRRCKARPRERSLALFFPRRLTLIKKFYKEGHQLRFQILVIFLLKSVAADVKALQRFVGRVSVKAFLVAF